MINDYDFDEVVRESVSKALSIILRTPAADNEVLRHLQELEKENLIRYAELCV